MTWRGIGSRQWGIVRGILYNGDLTKVGRSPLVVSARRISRVFTRPNVLFAEAFALPGARRPSGFGRLPARYGPTGQRSPCKTNSVNRCGFQRMRESPAPALRVSILHPRS